MKGLLLLFDGNALIHRAFHALPNLTTKDGEPTGALYGFVSMVLKVLQEFKPSYWAVAFDHPSPTFRHEIFPQYKAQRPKAPDELAQQIRKMRELVKAFNIPSFEVPGYEADDILGTLAKQARDRGIRTIIVTGDTDTLQLVRDGVEVLLPRPGRPFSDTQLYDEKAVKEKYGLWPWQIPDLKGLKGDPSDNIPGVSGVGQKTTLRLIQEFGSVEEIYRRLDEVEPPKLREILRQNEKTAKEGKELATIKSDVPITLDLDSCRVSGYDRERVKELFREFEFFSLLNKLPETIGQEERTSAKREVAPETRYQLVTDAETLDGLLEELAKAEWLVIDTETTSQDARKAQLVGLSLSTRPGRAWYLPLGHKWSGNLESFMVREKLGPYLRDVHLPKIAHNGKYDWAVLLRHDLPLENLAFDTMVAAYLLGEKSLGLKQLAFGRLGLEMTTIDSLIGSGKKRVSMADLPPDKVVDYACADADITGRLKELLEKELKEKDLWRLFTEVEMPLLPVLLRMELNGVALDLPLLQQMSQRLSETLGELEAQIYNAVGHQFNINSPRELSQVLFEELGLKRSRKTKTGYSTDAAVLEGLRGAHPVIELLLEYRQLSKLKSTYIDALPSMVDPETGRVYTNFNQTATATGRLSSSEPNLQNIPVRADGGVRIREAFIAQGDALLLAADYSQVELRILAHLSQDPGLLAAFAHDEDIHTNTAAKVFGIPPSEVTPEMRRVAKTVNFGVIYGMSDYGLEQATGLSRQEAAEFIKTYFEKYRGVKEYIEATKKQAAEKGYVQTILGRRRYIPEIHSSNAQVRQAAERMAINMPVQGSAADIIKLAMIKIQRRMDEEALQSKLILQVHDELLFEVPPGELEVVKHLVEEIMPHALELSVPLKVELKVGKNWGEMS